jgi:hypothetical protein
VDDLSQLLVLILLNTLVLLLVLGSLKHVGAEGFALRLSDEIFSTDIARDPLNRSVESFGYCENNCVPFIVNLSAHHAGAVSSQASDRFGQGILRLNPTTVDAEASGRR